MSAFIVHRIHVAALVRFHQLADRGRDDFRALVPPPEPGGAWDVRHYTPQSAADCLMAENVRSVRARYEDADRSGMVAPADLEGFLPEEIEAAPELTPLEALKACDCLEYQSCETEEYRASAAYWLLDAIRGRAIHSLHGYGSAEGWSLSPESLAGRSRVTLLSELVRR